MTSHKLAHAYFLECCYGAGSRTWCVCLRVFSIAITRELRHSAKVCEPIHMCNSDFRDVRAMCGQDVMSDFHSAFLMVEAGQIKSANIA